jgi:hypothetical protein
LDHGEGAGWEGDGCVEEDAVSAEPDLVGWWERWRLRIEGVILVGVGRWWWVGSVVVVVSHGCRWWLGEQGREVKG